MHCDELWPNYRGAGFGGRGMFGKEVRSHTVGRRVKMGECQVLGQSECHACKQKRNIMSNLFNDN